MPNKNGPTGNTAKAPPRPRLLAISLLAIYAALLPVIGPLLDHHFAERLPFHSHVYLGSAGEHHHVYLTNHVHDHGQLPDHRHLPVELVNDGGAISLLSLDALNHSLSILAMLLVATLWLLSPPPADELLVTTVRFRLLSALGIWSRPPERPPCRSLLIAGP